MRKLTSQKTSYGFSLLEVLVAFSIAAVTLGIFFQIYAKGTTAAILGEEYAQAIIIAESRLARLSLIENLAVAEDAGRENDKFDWQVSVDDYVDEAAADYTPSMLLKQVKVTVSWGSAGKTRSVYLQSLKPVPVT